MKKRVAAAAVRLRLVERQIRIGDQLVDAGAVLRRDRDPGAGAEHAPADR